MAGEKTGNFFEEQGLNPELCSFPDTSQLSPQILEDLQDLGFPKHLIPQLPLIVCDQRTDPQLIVLEDNPEPTNQAPVTHGKPVYLKIQGIPKIELAIFCDPESKQTLISLKKGTITNSNFIGQYSYNPDKEHIAVIELKDGSGYFETYATLYSIPNHTNWREFSPSDNQRSSKPEPATIQAPETTSIVDSPISTPEASAAEKPKTTPMDRVRADCRRLWQQLEQTGNLVVNKYRQGIYIKGNKKLILSPDGITPVILNFGEDNKRALFTITQPLGINNRPLLRINAIDSFTNRLMPFTYGREQPNGNRFSSELPSLVSPIDAEKFIQEGGLDTFGLPEDVDVTATIKGMMAAFATGNLEMPRLVPKTPSQIVRDRLKALLKKHEIEVTKDMEVIKPMFRKGQEAGRALRDDKILSVPLVLNLTARRLNPKPEIVFTGKHDRYWHIKANLDSVLPRSGSINVDTDGLISPDYHPVFILTEKGVQVVYLKVSSEILNRAFAAGQERPRTKTGSESQPSTTVVYESPTSEKKI